MKTTYLSSKSTKTIQILLFLLSAFLLPVFLFSVLRNIELLNTVDLIRFIFFAAIWLYSIIILTRIADAKLSGNFIIYKTFLNKERQFRLDEISQIKIMSKKNIRIKFKFKDQKRRILFNVLELSTAFDIHKIITDAQKEFEKEKEI